MARKPTKGAKVIPLCAEICLLWTSGTRKWRNVLHGAYGGTPSINAALAESFFAAIKARAETTALRARLGPDVSFVGVTVRDLRTAHLPEFQSTGAAVVGTGTGATLPLSVALVVTIMTNFTGQANRGRAYLAGLTDAQLANNTTFTAAAGTDSVAFIAGVDSIVGAQGMGLGVAQVALDAGTDHAGNHVDARAAFLQDATAYKIASARVDSQRRRTGR